MADDTDTETPPEPIAAPAPQAPATPAPPTVTMTMEEFEAKLNERAAQVRRAEQAKVKPQPEPSKPKKGDDPQPQGLSEAELTAMLSRRSSFDRALGRANLEDEQVSILEALFNIEKPADPAEWVARKSKAFGKPATPTPAPAPTPQAKPDAPTPAPQQPAPQHPAPTGSSQPQLNGSDPLTLSKDQQVAYLRSAGYDRRNPFTKEARVAAHKLRLDFEKRLQDVRLRGPDER